MSFFIDLDPHTYGYRDILRQALNPQMRAAVRSIQPVTDPVVRWQAEAERMGRIPDYFLDDRGPYTGPDRPDDWRRYRERPDVPLTIEEFDEEEIETPPDDEEITTITEVTENTYTTKNYYNTYNTYQDLGVAEAEPPDQGYVYVPPPTQTKEKDGMDWLPLMFLIMMMMNTGVAGQTLLQRNPGALGTQDRWTI